MSRTVRRRKTLKLVSQIDGSPTNNSQNLLIQASELFTIYGIDHKGDQVDVTDIFKGSVRQHKGHHKINLSFGKMINEISRSEIATSTIKAISIIRFSKRKTKHTPLQNFINAGRILYDILKKDDKTTTEISNHTFKLAKIYIIENYAASTQAKLIQTLCEYSRLIDYNKLSIHQTQFNERTNNNTGNEEKIDKRADIELFEYIGNLYQSIPKTEIAEAILVRAHMLISLTGRRIGELLSLPHQTIKIDEYGCSYIIYLPEKRILGLQKLVEERLYLIPQTIETIRLIIYEINELTQESRFIAESVENNQNYNFDLPNTMSITQEELAQWLDISLSSARQWATQKKIKTYRKNGGDCFYLTSDILETVKLIALPKLVGLQKTSELMFILPLNSLHSAKKTFKYAARGLTEGQFRLFLNDRGSIKSIARKYEIEIREGLRKNSHCFRHFLNDNLDKNGLNEVSQAEWFARRNETQNSTYQATTPQEHLDKTTESLRQAFASSEHTNQKRTATIQEAYCSAKTRAVFDHGNGFCVHHWRQQPCIEHLKNPEFPIDLLNSTALARLQRQENFTLGMIDMAKAQASTGKHRQYASKKLVRSFSISLSDHTKKNGCRK